jgi:hypothetical protein
MTKSSKTVLLVVLGLCLFGCLGAGGLMWLFASAASSFGGSGEWSADAVPERELPALFALRLPVKPLHYEGRQLGFQDAYFEVLVQLPPGSAEAFLSSNKLTRGPVKEVVDVDVSERIRALEPSTPALEATPLVLPDATRADGGTFGLTRGAVLLEGAGGETWVHLTAFET